ncbi:hypothetical protein [Tychonema sp. LEGE 07203]|uniref:hypothetical protein n=1 Tax=Tychonema sp. LEGE 07203 TaxID=1828671 RepID=UPI00187F2B07|nr:hypothetical protein [Tychonema sp. LEGE 07203]MBE9097711.1 hypothetical protein [Tychonema sp. LEGE 07203]
MHLTPTGLPNHNSIASQGSYASILSESVIFFHPTDVSEELHLLLFAKKTGKWLCTSNLELLRNQVSLRLVTLLRVGNISATASVFCLLKHSHSSKKNAFYRAKDASDINRAGWGRVNYRSGLASGEGKNRLST